MGTVCSMRGINEKYIHSFGKKYQEKRSIAKLGDYIKLILKKQDVDWIDMAQNRISGGFFCGYGH